MNLPRSLSVVVAAVVIALGSSSCRQKAGSAVASPTAEEGSETAPAAKPKLSKEDRANGERLIGKAKISDEFARKEKADADQAESEYNKLKSSAVTAGDVMRAQEAKERWKELQEEAEKDRKTAVESAAEAHRILGDEYPSEEELRAAGL